MKTLGQNSHELTANEIAATMIGCWQPIETCPMNKDVLVWCRDQCLIGKIDSHGNIYKWGADWFRMKENPTHWIPLPEPPTR
jgi:hypothetical protein